LLKGLLKALEAAGGADQAGIRRQRGLGFCRRIKEGIASRRSAELERTGPISKAFLTQCLNEAVKDGAILVNEYSAVREQLTLDRPGSFFFNPPSAGLGWGLPAALGVKQALPDKTVIAVVGDGAYIFANPGSCHHASAMHELPTLTIVFNNGGWDAVQRSATMVYPGQHAEAYQKKHGMAPLSSLAPVPAFEKYSEASGGYGERVESRKELPKAIKRALHAVTAERRQALLNVIGV
jgi:acetolactate synthase-1/2/3 large subunit